MRILVPFAAGGGADTLSRTLAPLLGAQLGTAVVVENRPGAGGLLATEACARAPADGSVLCLGTAATHSVLPHQMAGRAGARPEEFTPVARLIVEPNLLVVRADHPAADADAFVAWARARGSVPIGVPTVTAVAYLMLRQAAQAAGFGVEAVVYRSYIPAALLAGEVPAATGPQSLHLGHIRDGRFRAVLILGPTRSAALPDVPSFAETILPGAGVAGYMGLFGPAGMRPEVLARLHAAVVAATAEPAFAARVAALGMERAPMDPAAFRTWLAATSGDWATLLALAPPEGD